MISDDLDKEITEELNQHISIMEEPMSKGNKPSGSKKDKVTMKKKKEVATNYIGKK